MIDELKKELLARVKNYIEVDTDIARVQEALDYTISVTKGVTHHDGSYYILHIIRTAIILTELHSDTTCIVASLLGSVPNSNDNSLIEDINNKFGSEVSNIASSLYKISNLKLRNENEASAIALRKVMVGLSSDVRVIIIKLASRLDNLREVYTKPDEIQKLKCIETESVLIPIAHRLGINLIKSELEDLCLKYLRPDGYKEVLDLLNADYKELNGYIEEMKS